MIIEIQEFRDRVAHGLPGLIDDLQSVTGRTGFEEKQAWGDSLPQLSRVFAHPAFSRLHLYIKGAGALSLEYQLPSASAWCDVVLLGRKKEKPAAVIIELKHWQTHADSPGAVEGLIEHFGQATLHPSDQVRGYAEYCRRFHSAVLDRGAEVSGCVLFTRDPVSPAYQQTPNKQLTAQFPCFSMSEEDLSQPFPAFIGQTIEGPDADFADDFERGTYKQDRSFVRQIGDQILDPTSSPFELLDNQRRAFALCRAHLNDVLSERFRNKKRVIVVKGPPGSGKSVVAAKLWATLATDDELPEGAIVFTSTSASQNSNWSHLFQRSASHVAGAGVVKKATSYSPITTHQLGQLRKKQKDTELFGDGGKWRNHLPVLKALHGKFQNGARDNEYLVSVVDEAHALINSEHSDGRGQFGFVTGLGPQGYHIMRASRVSVFLLDVEQGFRARENTTIEDLKTWAAEVDADYSEVSLEGSQFRCAGSKEYVDWIESVLDGKSPETCRVLASAWRPDLNVASIEAANVISFPSPVLKVAEDAAPYQITPKAKTSPKGMDFRIFGSLSDMETVLRGRLELGYSARLLASYARPWKTQSAASPHDLPPSMKDFYFEENDAGAGESTIWSRVWNFVPSQGSDYATFIQGKAGSRIAKDSLSEVGCPYAVRGFDWDYVGLLWLGDLKYREGEGWLVDPDHVHETGIKNLVSRSKKEKSTPGVAAEALRAAVARAYRILLTRSVRGTFVWFEDEETERYVRKTMALDA